MGRIHLAAAPRPELSTSKGEVYRIMRKELSRVSAFLAVVITVSLAADAEDKNAHGHWVSAWSTAMHTPRPFPGLPPSPVFENQTIRMVVRPTIGGERVRVGLSNAYGTAPL